MYVYRRSEKAGRDGATADLFTVGFFEPSTGEWESESDHGTREEAATRVTLLNGGALAAAVIARLEALESRVKQLEAIETITSTALGGPAGLTPGPKHPNYCHEHGGHLLDSPACETQRTRDRARGREAGLKARRKLS